MNNNITHQQLQDEALTFFEWPTEDRTHVTLTSAILFAKRILGLASQRENGVCIRDSTLTDLGWHPVETAPKDRPFLGYLQETQVMHVLEFVTSMEDENDYGWIIVCVKEIGSVVLKKGVTHWMELPAPPTEKLEDMP